MLAQGLIFLSTLSILTCVNCTCDENLVYCKTPDGRYGACENKTCTVIQAEDRDYLQFAIIVKYPENTLAVNRGKELYMRGNALGFNWQTGVKLNKTSRDTWRADVTYSSSVDGFRCKHCADNNSFTGAHFEHRIYVDDRLDMVGGNLQIKLPISMTSSYFNDTPVFYAYPWFFSKKGRASVVSIHSPQIGKNRSILLYRPPSFYENTYKTYPTILVFDLNEIAYNVTEDLINDPIVGTQTVGEFIMVGFGDYHNARTVLLTQVPGPMLDCINGTFADRCNNCLSPNYAINYTTYETEMRKCGKEVQRGGKGNDTLDFLIRTALPNVRNLTQMRMLTDQPHLGVMGYSLGGLMACHAAWTRPNTFGFAACQSPSFWWPKMDDSTDGFFFNNVTLKDPMLRTHRPQQKIYLDAGGLETNLPSALAQAMVSAAKDMSTTEFFEWNENLWVDVYPGDVHSGLVWASRIWKPLRIFFPTHPSPQRGGSSGVQCEKD